MRLTIIKVIIFLSLFCAFTGIVLPWAISNKIMPLWADILLISLTLCAWAVLIELITSDTIGRYKKQKNNILDK